MLFLDLVYWLYFPNGAFWHCLGSSRVRSMVDLLDQIRMEDPDPGGKKQK